ncbi:MAG: DUF1501 domain-containing protein [Planctomycetaceae bacterium]
MNLITPKGMSRRHFLNHVATGVATLPALQFLSHLQANAQQVKKNQKACILMWMGGGPPTIDIWDLKPGSKNGGEFKPVSTAGDMQISEHMPETAKIMNELSLVRSMSTREADHGRGRYFMHTSYVPNPTVVHPTFGSVVSYELGGQRKDLEIPAFVSVGGPSESSGFLGMTNAPFVVNSNGQIQNAAMGGVTEQRLNQRLTMLAEIESSFIKSKRGETPLSHKEVYSKAVNLMTSPQREAFKVDQEKPEVKEAYGRNGFGEGLLLARRLVESGVPFVEVNMGGWDLHSGVFNSLKNNMLPQLDRGIAALTNDLKQRGLLEHTVLVWMGEFARTPRINQDVGRDHWANSWSVMVGGGGLKGGRAIGETDADGTSVVGKSYVPGDVWSTVAHALGIPLDKVYTSKNGRPMKITNGGAAIAELIG